MRFYLRIIPALIVTLLAGCSVLPEAQTSTAYLLPSAAQAPSAAPPVDWALRVVTPQASQVLDSTRIAVLPQANQISNYKGARWSDPAPALLRDRLLDALRADGRVPALSSDARPLHADLLLVSDLRAFQAEYQGGTVQVSIQLEARLVRSNGQHIVASQRFDVRQAVEGTQVAQVVDAFGLASDQLAAQLVDWAVAQGQASVRLR
jgi:cholesterol transport system auxiliary component